MKRIRIVSLLLVITSLFLVCGTFSACSQTGGDAASRLRFGKKYMTLSENTYYIFYKDGTGEYHTTQKHSSDNKITSGMVTFVWKEASGGVIYLFSTGVTYDKEHNSDNSIGIPSYPFHVSEDFIAYTKYTNDSYSSSGASVYKFYRENSDLWEALKNK